MPSRPRFKDEVEWRLCGPAKSRESGIRNSASNTLFAGLRAERSSHFLC
jgi:hypothetical protein